MLKAAAFGRSQPSSTAEYAARALLLSGYALSPLVPSLADRRLARLLLRECCLACASASRNDTTIESLAAALAVFPEDEAALGVLDLEPAPSAEELREAERRLSARVKTVFGERNPRRLANGVGGGLLLIGSVIVAAVVITPLVPRPEYESFRWYSSTSAAYFRQDGKLGETGTAALVVHTAEQKDPWVVIDTLRQRPIKRVILRNREDCCTDRGLPLVVEVGVDRNSFVQVGRRDSVFDEWTLEFPERTARYVRLRSESTTVLHLSGVQVE